MGQEKTCSKSRRRGARGLKRKRLKVRAPACVLKASGVVIPFNASAPAYRLPA